MQRFDVIVIGQGYAGLCAASLAAQKGKRTANLEAMFAGGLVMSINDLDPVPEGGEPMGAELTGNLAMANMDNGVECLTATVEGLFPATGGGWKVSTDAGEFHAPAVIVASGARLRKLGVPGEEEFFGRGVSECADCDGPMYMGAQTVIVGGGDSAFQEALALSHYAGGVTIVMRRGAPRARAELVAQAAANPAIRQLFDTEVTEILGDEKGVTGVRLRSRDGAETVHDCRGVFVFIGLAPNTGFLPETLRRDEAGAVLGGAEGLWVIGAARSGFGGMLSDAAEDARQAVAAIG